MLSFIEGNFRNSLPYNLEITFLIEKRLCSIFHWGLSKYMYMKDSGRFR